MTITRINTKHFKALCEQAREAHEWNHANGFDHMTFKDELENALACAQGWRVTDEWRAAQAAAPATWQEVYDNLSLAAAARQQFGATDAQIRKIADMAVRERLPISMIGMTALTKAEASAIIDSMVG